MGLLYGKLVQAAWDFYQDLQQPYTAAVWIILVSAIVTVVCLRLARRHDPFYEER